jgi:hypothetical protein
MKPRVRSTAVIPAKLALALWVAASIGLAALLLVPSCAAAQTQLHAWTPATEAAQCYLRQIDAAAAKCTAAGLAQLGTV